MTERRLLDPRMELAHCFSPYTSRCLSSYNYVLLVESLNYKPKSTTEGTIDRASERANDKDCVTTEKG